MNQVQPDRTLPVLLGGTVLGVLSAIPIIGWANCFCCVWGIAGGVLASYMYLKEYPRTLPPVTYGDGALLGVLAGVVGAAAFTLVSIPINMLFDFGSGWESEMREALSDPEIPAEVRNLLESLFAGGLSIGMILIQFLISLVLFAIFAGIGGILGIAIFQKKAAPPPGQPAPQGTYQPPAGPPSPTPPPAATPPADEPAEPAPKPGPPEEPDQS